MAIIFHLATQNFFPNLFIFVICYFRPAVQRLYTNWETLSQNFSLTYQKTIGHSLLKASVDTGRELYEKYRNIKAKVWVIGVSRRSVIFGYTYVNMRLIRVAGSLLKFAQTFKTRILFTGQNVSTTFIGNFVYFEAKVKHNQTMIKYSYGKLTWVCILSNVLAKPTRLSELFK